MLTKPQAQDFNYRVEKPREFSAMGGFPVSREAAKQAVKQADEIPLPDLAALTKEAEKQISAGAPSEPLIIGSSPRAGNQRKLAAA